MTEVFITKAISDNEDGAIDEMVKTINSAEKGGQLIGNITCIGGDTFQGDRLYRAIEECEAETVAVVVGVAASMGSSLLPAFDRVEYDPDAKLMFHSAKPKDGSTDLSGEQKMLVDSFNEKTQRRMIEIGVDAEFVKTVFSGEIGQNFWITAQEAETLGLGKVVPVNKEKHKRQFAIAAELDLSNFNNTTTMNLFKKAVPRIVNLADGRQAIFESKEEKLKVNDKLTLVGSSEVLTGKVLLENNMSATLNEMGLVKNMEEVEEPKAEISDEMFSELMAKVAALEEALATLMAEKEAGTEAEAEEAEEVENKVEELDKKGEELDNKINAANSLINSAMEVAESLKTSFKIESIENKSEQVQEALTGLSESEKRAHRMRTKLNEE